LLPNGFKCQVEEGGKGEFGASLLDSCWITGESARDLLAVR
jgi:hypothetical protein